MTGDELRSLMRLFPSGVCVVTADADGDRIGVTIGSLVSLSLEPPLVGISVGKANALHEIVRSAGAFGVSLLRGDQADVAARFALGMPPLLLWEGVNIRDGTTGAPLIADALGWLECRVDAEHEVGDHTLFVGEIVAVEEGQPGTGLVYRTHGYHAV
jgi:flavin reductase (DIM6/NTAB) family NADH-FMN oxidoreductase RutF